MAKLKDGDFYQTCKCGWETEKSGDYDAKCPKCRSRLKTIRIEKPAKKKAPKKVAEKAAPKKAPAKKKAAAKKSK